jgi:hypothetical protein
LFEFNEKKLFLHLDFVLLTVVSIFLLFGLASLGFSSRADLVLSIFLFPSLSLPGPVRAELFLLESQSSAGVRSSTFPRFHRQGFFFAARITFPVVFVAQEARCSGLRLLLWDFTVDFVCPIFTSCPGALAQTPSGVAQFDSSPWLFGS